MARYSINATLGTDFADGRPNVTSVGGVGDASNPATAIAAAAASVAVGAGDSSVQNLATQAAIVALGASLTTPTLKVDFDNAVITSRNQLKAALDAVLQSAISSGRLTP